MDRFFWIFLLMTSFIVAEEPEIAQSTSEQIVTFTSDRLIGGVISPLSGQVCLQSIDLVAKGAQEVVLNRTYVAPSTPHFSDNPDLNNYKLHKYYLKHYKGWKTFPHDRIEFFRKPPFTFQVFYFV